MNIEQVPITLIKPDPKQPRRNIHLMKEEIADLAQSIKHTGIINPIEVDETDTIVTGELRFRAAAQAGLKEVPIRRIKITEDERLVRQLAENLHHNLMDSVDTAKAVNKLYVKRFKAGNELPQDQGYARLGRLLGKPSGFIKDMLNLADEPAAVQRAVQNGKVPYTALRDANAFPEEVREEVRAKVLKGEIKRDVLKPLKRAVETTPEKADELLTEDYSGRATDSIAKIHDIAPSTGSKVVGEMKRRGDAPKEMMRLAERLSRLLVENYYSEVFPNWLQPTLRQILEKLQQDIDYYLTTTPRQKIQVTNDEEI